MVRLGSNTPGRSLYRPNHTWYSLEHANCWCSLLLCSRFHTNAQLDHESQDFWAVSARMGREACVPSSCAMGDDYNYGFKFDHHVVHNTQCQSCYRYSVFYVAMCRLGLTISQDRRRTRCPHCSWQKGGLVQIIYK